MTFLKWIKKYGVGQHFGVGQKIGVNLNALLFNLNLQKTPASSVEYDLIVPTSYLIHFVLLLSKLY